MGVIDGLGDLAHDAQARFLPAAGEQVAGARAVGGEDGAVPFAGGVLVGRRERLVQRSAAQQFHREERDAALLADGVDRHDARVVQPRDDLDLAAEPFAGAGEEQLVGADDLQCHLASERLLHRGVDDPHAAGAQFAQQAEVAESFGDRRAHHTEQAERAQRVEPRPQRRGVGRVVAAQLLERGLAVGFEHDECLGDQIFELGWIGVHAADESRGAYCEVARAGGTGARRGCGCHRTVIAPARRFAVTSAASCVACPVS